jgi:hypothetical protein
MDAGRDDVVVAAGNGAEVEVADRASCVAAELQVDQALRVGDPDGLGAGSWSILAA